MYEPAVSAEMLIEVAEHLRSVSDRFNWEAYTETYGNEYLKDAINSMIDGAIKMAQLLPSKRCSGNIHILAYNCFHRCEKAAAELTLLMGRIPALKQSNGK